MKKYFTHIGICIVGLILIGGISFLSAASFEQPASIQVETMNVDTINATSEAEMATGEFVGGLTGTTHFTYEVEVGTDLSVGDDLTISDQISQGEYDVDITSGSFTDATTTPVAVLNPFAATSTVRLMVYNSTGVATSTHSVFCATSSTAFGAITTADHTLIGATSIATSSAYQIETSGTSVIDWASGAITYDTNVAHVIVKPTEYIVCTTVGVPVAYNGAFTEVTNTYAGSYMIKWERFSP